MTSVMSRGCLRGRPFGGVACLVRDHLATRVQLVKSASRHIILLLDSLLLINVYMPCSSSDGWVDDYLDCLASIMNDISELQYSHIILAGDMNLDLYNNNKGSLHNELVVNVEAFFHELGMKCVDDKVADKNAFTYRVDASNAASFIDHIAVSNCLYDSMHSVNVLDSGINFSDHCPVAVECTVPVSAPLRTAKSHYLHHRQHQVSFRWDKGNLHQYYC